MEQSARLRESLWIDKPILGDGKKGLELRENNSWLKQVNSRRTVNQMLTLLKIILFITITKKTTIWVKNEMIS